MSPSRLLLFALFFFGLFHIYLFVTRDPGLRDPTVLAEVQSSAGFSAVAVGPAHTCAIGTQGGVWCWGAGEAGQLGHARFSSSRTPVPVVGLPTGAQAVATGGNTSCALLEGGDLWCWGSSASGQIGLPATAPATAFPQRISGLPPALSVAVGSGHICASTRNGQLYCWGETRQAEGTQIFLIQHDTPQAITPTPALTGLSAGDVHTCGSDAQAQVYCWGGADAGALGHAEGRNHRAAPSPLPIALTNPAQALASSGGHSCALDAESTVWCWGRSEAYGQPSPADPTLASPARAIVLPGARAIAAGWNTTCALGADGRVACVGLTQDTPWSPFPPAMRPFSSIDGEGERICGLDAKGAAWCGPLTPEGALFDAPGYTPASWKADNSLAARWHRMAGMWAQRYLASQQRQ